MSLNEQMTARADRDGLPAGHDLRLKAEAFKVAAAGYWSDPPTVSIKEFMGCWARARRAWSEYSGEPLISR